MFLHVMMKPRLSSVYNTMLVLTAKNRFKYIVPDTCSQCFMGNLSISDTCIWTSQSFENYKFIEVYRYTLIRILFDS